ncbi:MAG: YbaB/EbfC family nucleoid-associated protein [Candidatus Marinimicrobia bacterium]|nr:YbaB/EbfC family nucleoid-associated protein [Candidatus Neomarinimicrobiota bacterium]
MMNPKNMGKMMKQAQQMQKKMGEVQQRLSELEVTGKANNGLVKVIMDGKQKVIDIKIDSSLLNEDIDMLEDLILTAINEAVAKSHEMAEKQMNNVTGNLLGNIKLPGM